MSHTAHRDRHTRGGIVRRTCVLCFCFCLQLCGRLTAAFSVLVPPPASDCRYFCSRAPPTSLSDDGATWGPIRIAVPGNATYFLNYPSATVLGSKEGILLLFEKGGGGIGDGVWATRSFDEGLTWTAATPTGMPGGCAAYPAVALPTGRLVVACGNYAFISEDGQGKAWRRSHGNISRGLNMTGGMGESVLVADGRGTAKDGLSMLIRASSTSSLENHALAQSSDGGDTWSTAELLPEMMGTTCQGGAGHDPAAPAGELLLSAPSWPDGGLGGRRNVSLWKMDASSGTASGPVASLMTVWGGAGGYSVFDTTGGKVRLLFEAGNHIYNWGIKIARLHG